MKEIKGLEKSGYFIDDDMDIYSVRTAKKLKHSLNTSGYPTIGLMINRKRVSKLVHRLIAETFIENPNNFPFVNHKDCNKRNNAIENLEWCTAKMNSKHAIENGRYKVSEKMLINGKRLGEMKRKVSMEVANKIREEYKSGVFQRNLSLKYGVARSAISAIVNGKTYNV